MFRIGNSKRQTETPRATSLAVAPRSRIPAAQGRKNQDFFYGNYAPRTDVLLWFTVAKNSTWANSPIEKTSNDQRVNREKHDEKLIRGSCAGENARYK